MDELNSRILRHKNHSFVTLTEFNRVINSFNTLKELTDFFLLTLMGKFLITRSAIIVLKDSLNHFVNSKGIKFEDVFPLSINPEQLEKYVNEKFISQKLFSSYYLLKSDSKLLGILLLNFYDKKQQVADEENILFDSLINVTAIAIERLIQLESLTDLNKSLKIKNSFARSLFELSKEFSQLLSEAEVFHLLSRTIMGSFLTNKVALVEFINDSLKIIGNNFETKKFQILIDELNINAIDSILCFESPESKFINLRHDLIQDLQIALIIPLFIKNKLKGIIFCGRKLNNQVFTAEEIEFIDSLGSLTAITFENIKLFKETLEKQRIEEDIKIAKSIQQNLLPSTYPDSELFEFFGLNEPSRQIGGDYFDVFRINDNQIIILIADVVGKGIGASLIMMNLQATVKALTRQNFSIKESTVALNNLMKENLSTGNFITFFWGILDEKNKTLEYVNAGHNPPLLISRENIKRLNKGGIILGVLELYQNYESEIIELKKDDLIVLFTDGFIEATNEKEEEFGEENFINFIKHNHNLPLELLAHKIIDEIMSYSNNSSTLDDLTLLLTKCKS